MTIPTKRAKARPRRGAVPDRPINAKGKGPIGRPPKFTPDLAKSVLTFVKAGNYYDTAARAAGISPALFYNWCATARLALALAGDDPAQVPSEKRPYVDFLEELKKAEATAEIQATLAVRQAFADNWTAAMTFLERRHPERWGRKDRLDVNFDPKKLTTEQLEQLEDLLLLGQRD